MNWTIRIAAAQMAPTQKAHSRAHMVALPEGAASRGGTLAVFPELAFTPFSRWLIDGDALGALIADSTYAALLKRWNCPASSGLAESTVDGGG